MAPRIEALLSQLRILDDDKTLSLTSILLMVAITRLALFPADAYTVGILTLALANSNLKKFSHHKRKQQQDAVKGLGDAEAQRIETIESQIKQLNQSLSLKKLQG